MLRKYCKVPQNELTQAMVDVCLNSSLDSIPVFNGLAILKYEGSKPAELDAYEEQTDAQIAEFCEPYLEGMD